MTIEKPQEGAPGTTEQSPHWEGPQDTKPRGYLPSDDDPETDRDAVGENLQDPRRKDLADALKTRKDKDNSRK